MLFCLFFSLHFHVRFSLIYIRIFFFFCLHFHFLFSVAFISITLEDWLYSLFAPGLEIAHDTTLGIWSQYLQMHRVLGVFRAIRLIQKSFWLLWFLWRRLKLLRLLIQLHSRFLFGESHIQKNNVIPGNYRTSLSPEFFLKNAPPGFEHNMPLTSFVSEALCSANWNNYFLW